MEMLSLVLCLPLVLSHPTPDRPGNPDPAAADPEVSVQSSGTNVGAIAQSGTGTPRAAGALPGELEKLVSGTRLRVALVGEDHRLAGTLATTDHRQLVLQTQDRGLVTIALDDVSGLEKSLGTRSHWQAGAIIAGVGGPVLACAITRPCIGPGTFVFAALTGSVGALIGKCLKSERWKAIDITGFDVAVAPSGGVSASVSVSF